MERFDFVSRQLDELKEAKLLRSCVCIDSVKGVIVKINGEEKLLFCSNNYLSLAAHPQIAEAVVHAVREYGYGAGASRLLSGTTRQHVKLEDRLAAFLQKQAAIVFPSGWTANEALLTTLPQKGDLILLDKFDHASIIDAAKASHAEFRTYRRDNLARLKRFLADNNYHHKHKFIVTESIFSMDGDTADLKTLVQLKRQLGALLVVDEAHAVGCLGPTGAGFAEQMDLLGEVDIVVATMSKALGATGGVVASRKNVIDLLVNKARSFIYTTAPSAANCAAVLTALDIVKAEPQRRLNLRNNAQYLRDRLQHLRLNTGRSFSHIIPVIIGDEDAALRVAGRLYEMGFFIVAIRPPTVPPGTARLRISVQSDHTKSQLDELCRALDKLIKKGLLPTLPD
jgi:8-amino-7-oxononanoate synthase